MPTLAAIIVTYNSRPEIGRALHSLRSANQVIVVDNASSDDTCAYIVAHHPSVCLVRMVKNVGFSRAVNAGAARASSDILLLFNPDAWLDDPQHPTFGGASCEALVAALVASGATVLGPRQVDDKGLLQLSCGPKPTVPKELTRRFVQRRFDGRTKIAARAARWLVDGCLARPTKVGWVAGSALLVWRHQFELIGGFDPGFFLFFEDIDFCLRISHAGGTVVYSPDVTVGHSRGRSASRAHILATRAYRCSQVRFAHLHMGRLAAALIARYVAYRHRRT